MSTEAPRNLWEEATSEGDVAEQFGLVELKMLKTRTGGPVKVLIHSVPMDMLLVAMKGLPSVDPGDGRAVSEDEPFDKTLERISQWGPPAREIARLGIVKPEFSFDNEAKQGVPSWASVGFADQSALVGAIMKLSGFGSKENVETRRFPASQRGGRAGRAATGKARKNGKAAVHAAAPEA